MPIAGGRIQNAFTFHYVSILMHIRAAEDQGRNHFTFHYVSILIILDCLEDAVRTVLYIPLCLYFNQAGETIIQSLLTFTFHYVSILI